MRYLNTMSCTGRDIKMTGIQIGIICIGASIALFLVIYIVNQIVEKREVDTAIQDSMEVGGFVPKSTSGLPLTNDPQFNELAEFTQELIDNTSEFVADVRGQIKRSEETHTELLENRLRLQRLEIQLDLLGKINSENVIQKYPHQRLDWWSVAATIHFVRNIIGSIAND